MKKMLLIFILFFQASLVWATEITVSLEGTSEGTRVTLEGKVSVRGPLELKIFFRGQRGPAYKLSSQGGQIKDGRIKFEFTTPKRFLLGKYNARLYQVESRKEIAEHQFEYGSQEKVLKEKKALHTHMLDLYQSCCEALELIRRGGLYFRDSLIYFKLHHQKEAARQIRRVRQNWRFERDFIHQLLRQNLQNLMEFRKSIYINPYEPLLKKLAKMMIYGKFLASEYSNWISQWLRWRRESYKLSSQIERIKGDMGLLNQEVAQSLHLPKPISLEPNYLASPFHGEIKNDSLKETQLKFSLAFDPALWKVSYVPVTPNIRLQLFHRQARVIVSIEIYEYPKAKSYQDLRIMTVISAQEMWPGFRKIKSQNLKIKMNGEEREAFDFTFITERSHPKKVFKNRVYQIFSQDKKTLYGLRIFAPADQFEDHIGEFEKLISQFKVFKK